MSNTRELARKYQNPFNMFGQFNPQNRRREVNPEDYYSEYDYFNSTIHEIRKATSEELYKEFKVSRPKAAAFLESMFGDMAKEVFSYFPPDISETKCGFLLASMLPSGEIDDNRAINSLDSHIEEL